MFLFLNDDHDGLGGCREAVGKGDVDNNGSTVIVLVRGNLEGPRFECQPMRKRGRSLVRARALVLLHLALGHLALLLGHLALVLGHLVLVRVLPALALP